MMKEYSDFLVTPNAECPAGKSGHCYYCQQPVGHFHKTGCVTVHKKVLVRMTVTYEVAVPASWDSNQIEFQRNEGGWCADNALEELEAHADARGCLCADTHFEYIEDRSGPYLSERG